MTDDRLNYPKVSEFCPLLLCIDDFGPLLELMKHVFESRGYRVLTAGNGNAGLEAFAMYHPDAVILDYDMPGMNGTSVAQLMRRSSPNVPIILYSGFDDIPDEFVTEISTVVPKGSGIPALAGELARLMGHAEPAQWS